MPNAPMPPLKPRVPTPEPQLDEEGNPLPEPEPDPDAPPPEKVRPPCHRLLPFTASPASGGDAREWHGAG